MIAKTSNSAISCFVCAFLVLFVVDQRWIRAQDLTCCSHATGSCRTECEKILLVDVAANPSLRNKTIQVVQKFCSSQLGAFWECLDATFKDMSRGDDWYGRVCCPLPQSETCRRACVTATSRYDLSQGCRKSDEIAFFGCLERQETGDQCCRNARSEDCQEACLDIFRSHETPNKHQRNLVKELCNSSPKVMNCVKNFTVVTPVTNVQTYMHCCDKSNKSKCRETCKSVLQTQTTQQEIIDGLAKGCGQPLLQDQFWQCFMKRTEVSTIGRVGMDSAKWHCCQKANSSKCKKLCSDIFTKNWSVWDEFQSKCLSEVTDEALRSCIDEVEEPCELGCDGLSFCTNFNNRPTEFFRSCTAQSDEAARMDVMQWQKQKELSLPGLTLPLINILKCSPNIWKAVACTLQIKPCSRHSHANQICRDVCLDILSQCVDWEKVSGEHSPESVCANLSPEDPNASCISLESFLSPSENTYQPIEGQVSSPCKGDPCESEEICTVNKNCVPGRTCVPYTCTPGCKLGEVSEYTVPDGTYVRIPITNKNKGCLKICRCNKGRIEDCQPLPCVTLSPCWMGHTQQRDHGVSFDLDCNTCSCFAGEVICSKKQCESTALSGRNLAYTTLPCNCPQHFMPVCGRNGTTYPSLCLAKCAGLSDGDIEHEACPDPCKPNTCPIGQKCVPNPQVCLSLMQKPCTQYDCINGTVNCAEQPTDPVCDIDNKEYENSCYLAHNNSKFGYRGPCLKNCRRLGTVCGINGKTYYSECAANADYITVDYDGPCIAVGAITDSKREQCPTVTCPVLPNNDCIGVTPPAACCPVCGGAIRLLYSTKQIDRALYHALHNQNTFPLTLRAMLRSLERQIQVAQCSLSGYLSVELDIFVLVRSTEKFPSELQLEACVREAEKIASLVNRQSPRIASELSLSSLTTANVVHVQGSIGGSGGGSNLKFDFVCLIMVFLVQLFPT